MSEVSQIMNGIHAIQESTDIAQEKVHEKINDFAEKVGVMEQLGLNVASHDPTIQYIIENREEVICKYKNDNHKKINN
jgi:hypothetical protein